MTKKIPTMDDHEDIIIKAAASLITRQLDEKGEVRIPGFGKFYLTSSATCLDHPMEENASFLNTHIQRNVRFKPFKGLKDQVRRRKKICKPMGMTCSHPDGEGHEGDHIDYRGRSYTIEILEDGTSRRRYPNGK